MSLQRPLQQTPARLDTGCAALINAVVQLAAAAELNDIVEVVRDTARDISGADGVCFVLREDGQCHYVDESAIAPLWKGKRFPMNACIAGWCMQNDETAVVTDVFADPRVPTDAYRPTFIKSMVLVPVRTTEPVGAIGFYWAETRGFSPEELALIESLGRSASAAFGAVQARQNLQESEHRLAMALDAGGLGAWELNLSTGELIATAACKKMFGCDPETPLARQALIAALHPDDQARAIRTIDTGAAPDGDFRLDTAGGVRRVEIRGGVFLDANGAPSRVSGIVRDVTEQFQARERHDTFRAGLLRAARLNDLGAMASALAHELNQPLAAASNYIHAAERLIAKDPEKALNALGKADAQFQRTREIVQRIRGFVGQGESLRQAEDVRSTCGEILELARANTLFAPIKIKLEFEPKLPKVEIDKVQIQQVLLNLLRNAFEAMAGRPKRQVTIAARQKDGMIEIRVSDTGPGVAPEIAAHLFQPFQTNKDGGMGVGLSLCRKIVETHGGKLWHEPSEEGATFGFSIPVMS